MSFAETIVLREPWDVDRRLAELGLGPRDKLLKVVAIAMAAAADATAFHPANAAGTFAYQHGTWALRDEYVGDAWALDRLYGVEAIRHDVLKIKAIFANVDIACNDDMKPKPRSRRGAGAERACMSNLFGFLPDYAPRQPADAWKTYYLMVAESGAAELTQPVVKDGTFTSYVERIYLADGSDPASKIVPFDEDDVAENFDPQVIRK